jgi:putative transposase
MIVRKAFKFRLKTNHKAEYELAKMAAASRFLWNKSLILNLDRLRNKQKIMWYQELNFWTNIWKKSEEYGFLKECHSQVLQQKLKDLDKAFKDAFDKTQPNKRIPKFKKKGIDDGFRYPQGFKVNNDQVYLPNIGWLRFLKSRNIVGIPKNVTISRHAGKWYVSIQTEYEVEQPVHESTKIVGIDLGVTRFATLSNKTFYKPKNSFKKLERKLKLAQRKRDRKVKFSNNWKKQNQRINKIHTKIANVRNDYLHWVSTRISKNHAMIVMEDLKIKNMSASAKGDMENPGRNVKAKSGLNKAILDQGWGEFRRQLEYKQAWRGGQLIIVNPKFTSQTCSKCDHVCADSRLSQSEFKCVACGFEIHADFNGALNVLRAGHAQLACGDIKQVDA